MTPLPHDQCFWVVPDRFLAGNYPGHKTEASAKQKLQPILDSGVDVFVDLTQASELKPYEHLLPEGVKHIRFPIRDVSVPRDRSEMTAILDWIDAELELGNQIYVHCWGGHGRTGTVVGCWLRRRGRDPQQAIDELQQLWQQNVKSTWGGEYSRTPQTQEQFDYIRRWRD
ncbi:MAG: hypothetical protein F4066_04565 [Chloroflexi bacterium]|nr:hypothetical protein [Chloroflexota bacterium]MYF80565.1 hypothetical protein [Chloroflexota bacterium]MYI04116.1 hypothetical protein [Chloroflexota bacterium]